MTPRAEIWCTPPNELRLPDRDVHIWRISLDQPLAQIQHLRQMLTGNELSRAGRFQFQKDRDQFIVARGALRIILSRYLKLAADKIRFQYTDYGKPYLASSFDQPALKFNLSHSGQLALCGVTASREIGVDLEKYRPMSDIDRIAQRFFSAKENEAYQSVAPHQKIEAFFNCWTRKEAYIKAIGEGLSHPLDTFDVTLRPGEPARLLAVKDNPAETKRWTLQSFIPAPNYVAALISEGQNSTCKFWQWSVEAKI